MSTVELQASAASELYRAELALSDARDSGVAAWITAASELYRAELALSDARDSGVAAWITAASNRLHDAVVRDAGARAALAVAA